MHSLQNIKKHKYLFAAGLIIVILILISAFEYSNLYNVIVFEGGNKKVFKISLHSMVPGISSICAEPLNRIVIEALVSDTSGNPVPSARINLSEKNGLGAFTYLSRRTDKNGSLLFLYTPPGEASCLKAIASADAVITASIPSSDSKASISFKLVRVPVVFIHGYKASPSIFGNFADHLKASGFMTSGLDYKSGLGVISGASQLDTYLRKLTEEYSKKGILSRRFDIIAHSMGGLVARYYTCTTEYTLKNNVSKIIFLSTPHKGSPFASLGLKYYNDQGIYDLMPDSELFTKTFPSLLNRGLNTNIRSGSILGQYDEVVSPDSASLEKWGIETEIFSVGENNFTMDKLLTGKIAEAANHKLVLDNLKVYKRVEEMLLSDIPYPEKIR